ncbi:MAG: mechanosensitive ion channel family protein [Plesiomonas sp.]
MFTSRLITELVLLTSASAFAIGVWFFFLSQRFNKHKKAFTSVLACISSIVFWIIILLTVTETISIFLRHLNFSYNYPEWISTVNITLISAIVIKYVFALIMQIEISQVEKGNDVTTSRAISRLLKSTTVLTLVLLVGQHFGLSLSGLMTFGGVGGIAIGLAGKNIISNFFSGLMLYFDRPFNVGDWIRSPDRNIEGTVCEIGWRLTKITTFDHRPLYVPNSAFSSISVENPSRMTNRRIKTTLGLRYQDAAVVSNVVNDINEMLKSHPDIDTKQTLLVYFDEFADSSLNIMIYCFTRTTAWAEWLRVQQDVYLKMIEIVHQHNADFAFKSQTLYIDKE